MSVKYTLPAEAPQSKVDELNNKIPKYKYGKGNTGAMTAGETKQVEIVFDAAMPNASCFFPTGTEEAGSVILQTRRSSCMRTAAIFCSSTRDAAA